MRWLEGRGDTIPSILGELFAEALEVDSRWARGEIGFWMWKAGAISGPPDAAAEPFALHMSGDWRAAADAWRTLGCPYEEALALADGDVDSMLAALEIFDRMGARPASTWLRGRLREVGVDGVPRGPRPSTLEHPAGLTRRQAEIFGLMSSEQEDRRTPRLGGDGQARGHYQGQGDRPVPVSGAGSGLNASANLGAVR
jgi:hypothetical protein